MHPDEPNLALPDADDPLGLSLPPGQGVLALEEAFRRLQGDPGAEARLAYALAHALQRLGRFQEALGYASLAALRFDLARAERTGPCAVGFRYKGTLEPYVEVGSAGVAKVLLRYGWLEQARPVLNDLGRKYSVLPGYLFGVAGIVDTLLDAYQLTGEPTHLARLERQLEGLHALHLFEPRACAGLLLQGRTLEGLAVPGEGLLRVSCDFATGCAGVLQVLHRVASPGPADFMLDEVTHDEDLMDHPGRAQRRVPGPAGG